jgi:dihydrofolate synthase/folylpolyglutamate synthase
VSELEKFLESKPLYYKEIDLERMPRAWKFLQDKIKLPKIIHIIGTNGKGSTGRFLSYYLYKKGFSTGHYSSPHILRFNERIWLEGSDVDDELLDRAHSRLQQLLDKKIIDSLSYFEYTTLVAVLIFEECDYVVMEAGLGGEGDATSVFENILTLVTRIGIDHTDFLGESIEEIASTKLKAIQKEAIISYQDHKEVYEVADSLDISWIKAEDLIDKQLKKDMELFIKNMALPKVFVDNLTLSMAAVKRLGLEVELDLLRDIKLFGRVQKIDRNVTIDVGHNELAAIALREFFKDKRVTLIYNSFKDKDYKTILKILKPIIKEVEIIDLKNERVEKRDKLVEVLNSLKIKSKEFKSLKDNKEYLVFGSFSVVEEFLKRFYL